MYRTRRRQSAKPQGTQNYASPREATAQVTVLCHQQHSSHEEDCCQACLPEAYVANEHKQRNNKGTCILEGALGSQRIADWRASMQTLVARNLAICCFACLFASLRGTAVLAVTY